MAERESASQGLSVGRQPGGTLTNRNALRIENGVLTVTPRGLDRLWAFRKHVTVPLTSITDVRIEHKPHRIPTGWRGPGLDAMGKLCGTFHPNGERHFWNYSGTGSVLSVVLADDQHFQQLHLSVEDAEISKSMLWEAVTESGSEGSQ